MGKFLQLSLVLLGLAAAAGCARIRPPKGEKPLEHVLVTTGYCRCGTCCGWRRTWYGKPVYTYGPDKGKRKQVGITANGAKARRGTIAADTRRYPFGTIMDVEGYGYGRVEDRGGKIKGGSIDLFFDAHQEAVKWGRQTIKVKVWLPPRAPSS